MDENQLPDNEFLEADKTSEEAQEEVLEETQEKPQEEISENLQDEAPQEPQKNKASLPLWCIILIIFLAFVLAVAIIVPNLKAPTKIIYTSPESFQNSNISENSSDLSALYKKCSPSTVFVSSSGVVGGFFNQEISLGKASGIIVSEDGYILTNASAVSSGANINVTLNDLQKVTAELIGVDSKTDIALIKINATELVPAVLGNSSNVTVGDSIISITNPLAPTIVNTLNYGIISGVNKNVALQKGVTLNLFNTNIPTDTASSGGAIFNANGEAVAIIVNISSNSDISFAIPINDVKPLLSSLLDVKNEETNDTPMLGITATDETYGVVVETVSKNYPADIAGVKVGDVIIKVDGNPVNTVEKINELRTAHARGDSMKLTIFRDGETIDITVILQ